MSTSISGGSTMAKCLCSRLLKKAHLRRWASPVTAAYNSYASFPDSRLAPGLFEQPARRLAAQAWAATPLEVVKSTNEAVLAIYGKHRVVDAAVEKEIFAVIDAVTDYQALAGGAIDPLVPEAHRRPVHELQGDVHPAAAHLLDQEARPRPRGPLRVRGREGHGRERRGPEFRLLQRREGAARLPHGAPRRHLGHRELRRRRRRHGRNYRKQFTQLLAKKTFEQVMEQLEKKIASLEAEK